MQAGRGARRPQAGVKWGIMSSKSGDIALGTLQTSLGPAVDTSQLPEAIAASAGLVDAMLDAVLPQPAGRQARVQEAMRYAIMAGRSNAFSTAGFSFS